jgi:ankyrin repeat protein
MKTITTLLLTAWSSLLFSQNNEISTLIDSDDLQTFVSTSDANHSIEVLNLALKKNAHKIICYLLTKDIAINAHDSSGITPLIMSVKSRNYEVIHKLLEKGADLNLAEKGNLQGTPLMYASTTNDQAISRLLLDKGALVNALDKNNDHALNWATYYGHTQVMILLLERGADLSLKSKHGGAIDVCFRLWHADSVANILRTNLLHNGHLKEHKLIVAVRQNNVKDVAQLLRKGAETNTKDVLGTPLIHMASERGNMEIMSLLIKHGADINQLNRVGQSALAQAARFGQLDIVKLLLQQGADVNISGQQYRLTPLIGAAVNGDIDIGELLLNAGAIIDQQDIINKMAALHWAMTNGNTQIAKTLIEAGADYNMAIFDGNYTGKSLAVAYGYTDLLFCIKTQENKSNRILGSWLMKEIQYRYSDTTIIRKMTYPGRLLVTPDRYAIMYNPSGDMREAAASVGKLTDTEMLYAFKTLVFNSGSYAFTDSIFTATPDIAKVAGFEGGKQYYTYHQFEDKLELNFFDETYPNGEKPIWYGKLKIFFILEREI